MTKTLTDILKSRLASKPGPIEGEAPTLADFIVEKLLFKATLGDVAAIQEIWDRVEPMSLPCENELPTGCGYSG